MFRLQFGFPPLHVRAAESQVGVASPQPNPPPLSRLGTGY